MISCRGERMTNRDEDLRELKDALEAKAISLISETLGAAQNRALSNRRIARWGRKGSFVYHVAGPMRGRWHDFEAGDHGDLLALIQRHHARGFAAAMTWARQWLGWTDGYRPTPRKSFLLRIEREKKHAEQEAEQAKQDAAKISRARRLIDGSVPLTDTAGEDYLRGRSINAGVWPDAIRWDPEQQAILFVVTDDAGSAVAAQLVAVTKDGKKDADRVWNTNAPDERRAKNSIGPIGRGAVRLPGLASGPICIAEGGETAASIWVSTGYETLAVLGSMARVGDIVSNAVKAGRRIVICRDDDPRTSPAAKAARTGVKAIKAMGGDVREAWPFEVRRGKKQDFNDLLVDSGPDAVRRRIDMVAVDMTPVSRISMSLDVAHKRIDEIVGAFFDRSAEWQDGVDPNVEALGVDVGTGKTEAALRHALRRLIDMRAGGDTRAIVFALPEHRLSDEVARRFDEMARRAGADLRAAVRRGREAYLPGSADGEKMCRNIGDIREAQALYADPDKDVCASCGYASGCAYLRQKDVDADLFVVSHNAIFNDLPANISRRKVVALVVDESPWTAGLIGCGDHPIDIPIDSLRPGFLPIPPGNGPEGGARLEDIRRILSEICDREPNGDLRRAALIDGGFGVETGHVAHKLEWRRKIDGKTEPNWRDREQNRTLGRMSALWRAVSHLIDHPAIELSGRLELTHDREGARVLRVRGRRDVGEQWRVPTLLVDAVLDVDLIRPFWPTVTDHGRYDVRAPYQKIRQAAGRAWAKTFMSPEGGDTPDKERQRKKARAIIMSKVREVGGRVLVIGNRDAIKAMALPPHVLVGWYGAVAGRDEWTLPDGSTIKGADLSCVILLGRQSPPVAAVERMAGALTGRASIRIDSGTGLFARADAQRLIRDGSNVGVISAESDYHPDEIAEKIRKRIAAGELVQAIGRARGIRRGPNNPVEVLVMTDVVLPMPIDELLPDEAFGKPTQADRMLAEGGIAFENSTSAAAFYPGLWPSAMAAKKAIQRGSGGHSLMGYPIRECPLLVFQRAGERLGLERACYDPAVVPDPRAAIEAKLGPLAKFEIIQPQAEPVRIAAGEAIQLPVAPPESPTPIVIPFSGIAVGSSFAGAILLGLRASERPDVVRAQSFAQQPANLPLDPTDEDVAVIPKTVWVSVRRSAKDGGKTMGDVAAFCGISPFHLCNIEKGRRSGSTKLLALLQQFVAETVAVQSRLF